MKDFIIHYTAEHGSFGFKTYAKKIKASSATHAKVKFHGLRERADKKAHRYGPFRRWYQIEWIEEAK